MVRIFGVLRLVNFTKLVTKRGEVLEVVFGVVLDLVGDVLGCIECAGWKGSLIELVVGGGEVLAGCGVSALGLHD